MKTRIIKKKGGKYYPQVKVNFLQWKTLDRWWGNLDVHQASDGSLFVMCTDYRVYAGGGYGCITMEEAQRYINDLHKQGYLYKPTGITPRFSDRSTLSLAN